VKIKKISIKDFGFISSLNLQFAVDKINIIQGGNGSGKTTVLAIIYSMFNDIETLKYKNDDKEAIIDMVIQDEEKSHHIRKRYYLGNANIEVKSFKEIDKLAKINRNNIYLLSSYSLQDKFWLSDNNVKIAANFLANLKIQDDFIEDVIFELLESNKSFHYLSAGKQMYIGLISVLSYIPSNGIVLVDGLFNTLDNSVIKGIIKIMKKMTDMQFIITAIPSNGMVFDSNIVELAAEKYCNNYAKPDFQYERFFREDLKKKLVDSSHGSTAISRPMIKYKRWLEVEDVEERNMEYKEIKGNNPCNIIIDTSEIYINAYLNSWVTERGIIKWGISDNGIVVGVKLSKSDRDIIARKIAERIGQMQPYVSQDLVKITFEKIVEDRYIVPELYIVEVIVEPYQTFDLISTSKDEVYIKTEGGKKRLKSYEIQQELKIRNKLS
jgi:ABC-type multidrug transport system ATPase subunit